MVTETEQNTEQKSPEDTHQEDVEYNTWLKKDDRVKTL